MRIPRSLQAELDRIEHEAVTAVFDAKHIETSQSILVAVEPELRAWLIADYRQRAHRLIEKWFRLHPDMEQFPDGRWGPRKHGPGINH
jgi:hypothetical protein